MQSIADFLNESRLSPGEAEALRVNAEFEKSVRASASKENITPGSASRIGSIRRKVSSVISNFTITPPRSVISSAESSFNIGTPTKKGSKQLTSLDVDDLSHKLEITDRTLSTASTLQVETRPESFSGRDNFSSTPYEAISPFFPRPTTDRRPRSTRRKPFLKVDTSACTIGEFTAIPEVNTPLGNPGGVNSDNALDDPFCSRPSKSPAEPHPLIVASNSWASEMPAIAHPGIDATSSARSSFRGSDESHIVAMNTLYSQKAQGLKAQNGKREVSNDDYRNFECAYKARAHSIDSTIQSCTDSLTESATIRPEDLGEQSVTVHDSQRSSTVSVEPERASGATQSTQSSRSTVGSTRKLPLSEAASDGSAHTSLLLASPTPSNNLPSPISARASQTYDVCCQGIQVTASSSSKPESSTPPAIIDVKYEPRQTLRHFSFFKKAKSPASTDALRGATIEERITNLRKRTGTGITQYKPTDERCRHSNHTRTWYSKK